MKYTILTFLVAFGSLVNAQANKGIEYSDGWAVTKKGDTLRGKICYENTKTGELLDKIFFMDASNLKKRYGSERITSFGTNGKVFEYVTMEDVPNSILMERMVEGDIDLYKAAFPTSSSTPQKMTYEKVYFLKKKDKPDYVEIPEKKFQKEIAAYFRGDEDIVKMVKDNNWGINDLDKIVKAYNAK